MRRARRVVRLLSVVLVGASASSCATRPAPDPIESMRNPALGARKRIEALREAERSVSESPARGPAYHAALKDVVWDQGAAAEVRLEAVRALLAERDEALAADARAMLKLVLPLERSRPVVAEISLAAGSRGWTEYIPALVRAYAREAPKVSEGDRSERQAIRALSPERTVERVIFDTVVNPPNEGPAEGVAWDQKIRADAWDALARLDPDGSMREAFFAEEEARSRAAGAAPDPLVADMRACREELRTFPLTGDEIRWLRALREDRSEAGSRWWAEARRAAATLGEEQSRGLRLRHMEPVRWAAKHRSEWLHAGADALAAELEDRMRERPRYRRSTELPGARIPPLETLSHWRASLEWGDLLTILVIDEALREPSVRQGLLLQADLDRRDKTTEYGGVLSARNLDEASFVAAPYPPRPGQRQGDERFIASADLFAAGDRGLAIYHFHAAREVNSANSGPSHEDYEFARRWGRNCLVFTCMNADTLNADYYQPNGAVIDLGEIRRGR